MQPIKSTSIYLHYSELLYRYARRIITDNEPALTIAEKVLYDQFLIDGLHNSFQLRQLLKTDTLHRCCCYANVLIFDKPIIKIPIK